jgi:hypothetical protein
MKLTTAAIAATSSTAAAGSGHSGHWLVTPVLGPNHAFSAPSLTIAEGVSQAGNADIAVQGGPQRSSGTVALISITISPGM